MWIVVRRQSNRLAPLGNPFVEVGGEGAEVDAVDDVVVIEIALVPAGHSLVEVGGEDAEVDAVDDAVEIRIAEKSVLDLNRTRAPGPLDCQDQPKSA